MTHAFPSPTDPVFVDGAYPPEGSGAVVRDAGRRLTHVRLGPPDAPPILLLHGITGSRRYWEVVTARLAGRRLVVAPDLLGFGASPKPGVRYDLETHVTALRAFLEVQGLTAEPLDVLGHSLGATLAVEYALHHPGHLRRVVLASLPAHPTRREAHARFLAGSGNYRRIVGQHGLGAMLSSWRAAGPSMALRYMVAFSPRIAADSRSWTYHSLTSTLEHGLLGHRIAPRLEALRALPQDLRPGLTLLHGALDQVTPLDHARAILPLLPPSTEFVVVRGTGHHPFRTHATACLAVAEAALSRNA